MSIELGTASMWFAALLTCVAPACNPGASGDDASPLAGAPSFVRGRIPEASKGGGGVPPALRAEYIRSVQARAGAAYRVEPTAAATVRTRSPAQGLVAELSPEGVQLTNEANGGSSGSLALAAFGCEAERAAVLAAVPRAEGNRVEYARGELVEWYVSGPLGLEQGFTLAAPPACRAQGGPVVVELAVRGQRAELVAEGARVALRDGTGRAAFAYSDLFARDAAGRTVPATMTVEGERLVLHVDDAGAAYPLQIDPLISTQEAKLLASDGADFDLFGASVALSGDTALVGAARDDERGTDAGAAYVFVRSGASWTEQAKLTAADGAANDNLGVSVALSGDTAVVGAMFADGATFDVGAAYVFVRSGSSWSQQAKLMATDGRAADQLGISLALSGDTALVGTIDADDSGERSGAAYVFVRSGTSWTQEAKLLAADGAARDQFGISVALSGEAALVGAWGDDDLGNSSGAAFVFVRSGTSWTQEAKLLAADGAEADQFGVSVALSGDTALVGANLRDENGTDSGSAYVFVRSGASWTQEAKLTATDGAEGDTFGASVALVGDTALIGAPNDRDLGAASGSAYVFTRGGTSWTQEAKLTAADGAVADLLGSSVALSDTTALVGALGDDDLGSSSGSAYVYRTAASGDGDACTANADCGSGFCADGVCCDTPCGGSDPDDCQACSVAAGAAVDGTCGPRAAGIVCRAAAGACDVAETCNGTSATCPADGFASASTVCRPAVNGCDAAERCTGSSVSCPGNELRPDLSLCYGGLLGLPGVCLAGSCVL